MGKIEEEGLRRFSHPVNIFIATKKIGVNVLTSAETSLIYKLINKSITYQAYRYDNKMVDDFHHQPGFFTGSDRPFL